MNQLPDSSDNRQAEPESSRSKPAPPVNTGDGGDERISARKLWILITLAAAQLLVILDMTIVNIAIPQASEALGLSDDGRQWIVTAYALAFGAFLLIGGRIADFWGRKRAFILGLAIFALASLLAGLALNGSMMIGGRVLQGVGAALMAPAALSLVSVTFPRGRARIAAFGVLGGITSSGAAVGLLVGGALTEYVDWRWCLLVNVPVVLFALIAALVVLEESRAEQRTRLDVGGAITISVGLAALVYGFTLAEQGWIEGGALVFVAIGTVALAVFFAIERRVSSPLLPLRVVLNRNRGGALIVQTCAGATLATISLYLTFHLQLVLGFPPLVAGVASVPLAITIATTMPFLMRLVPRVGPKPLLIFGSLTAAAGVLSLARVTAGGSYWSEVLPGHIVVGVGLASIFVTAQNLALSGVRPEDAGAAAAAANATNQIGGAIGLAVLTNVFAAAAGESTSPSALAGGYSAVFVGASVVMLIAAVAAVVLIRKPQLGDGEQSGPGEPSLALH